jgi:hypothetical protein
MPHDMRLRLIPRLMLQIEGRVTDPERRVVRYEASGGRASVRSGLALRSVRFNQRTRLGGALMCVLHRFTFGQTC